MGGFFGVVGRGDCVPDLFYGTDYHSHLGTSRGGLVVLGEQGFKRNIHDISDTPFRTKFEPDLHKHIGTRGLGVISDYEDQPMLIGSHHGRYAIVTVGELGAYTDPANPKHADMVERIRERLGLTSLRYQTLEDMVAAIGLPREKLCTYCWNGESLYEPPDAQRSAREREGSDRACEAVS